MARKKQTPVPVPVSVSVPDPVPVEVTPETVIDPELIDPDLVVPFSDGTLPHVILVCSWAGDKKIIVGEDILAYHEVIVPNVLWTEETTKQVREDYQRRMKTDEAFRNIIISSWQNHVDRIRAKKAHEDYMKTEWQRKRIERERIKEEELEAKQLKLRNTAKSLRVVFDRKFPKETLKKRYAKYIKLRDQEAAERSYFNDVMDRMKNAYFNEEEQLDRLGDLIDVIKDKQRNQWSFR
jgi:hypothetical protein